MPCGLPRPPQIATLTSGHGEVNSVAFSPDSKTLATGNANGTARLWNLATGQQTRPPCTAAPRPSLRWRSAQTARPWRPEHRWHRPCCGTWQPASRPGSPWGRHPWHRVGGIQPGRQDPGGHWRRSRRPMPAVGRGDRPQDRQTSGHSPRLGSVAFSPDGKTLATGNVNGTVQLWDVATGRQIGHASGATPTARRRWRSARTARHWQSVIEWPGPAVGRGDRPPDRADLGSGSQAIASVAFSPDGKTLATGEEGGSAECGTWRPGQQIGSSLNTHSGQVSSVAFSPDGKTLATGDDSGAARLWNVAAALQTSRAVSGGSYSAVALAFSSDGKTLATETGTARSGYGT